MIEMRFPLNTVGVRPFRMSKNNPELWNLFPGLLNCFFFVFCFFIIFTHFVWNCLVVKMRFERPTCCICRGTFCIQVSYSNNSAISPTESLATFDYRTPKIDYTWNFLGIFFTLPIHFFLLNNLLRSVPTTSSKS